MNAGGQGRCHRGSCLCVAGHELRVTERCVRDDLALPAGAPFEDLLSHPIVVAFRNERSDSVRGTTSVGPEAGSATIWTLRRGNDHRGATWHDAHDGVVWLVGYGRHRSGDPADAFPYFAELIGNDRIYPTPEDRVALAEDRAVRFAFVVEAEAQELLAFARSRQGVETRATIGTTQPVGLIVHIVDTMEQTFVAVYGDTTDVARLQLLLVALYPDHGFDEWDFEPRLPTRELDHGRGEFCLSIVHE
jgi:hypothetical protein